MASASLIEELEKKVRYHFSDNVLLRDALTHSSTGEDTNYERLEFLGDRVLGLVVAQILYEKFPKESEGDLAKRLAALVQGTWLAKVAHDIDLGRYMHFSEAERGAGGEENDNILADGMEALIGAIYMDSGLEPCQKVISYLWGDSFETMIKPPQHPKTTLQEWAQGEKMPLPIYEIVNQSGPDHEPVFEIKLSVKGYGEVISAGRSRQLAEKEAAKAFIAKLSGDGIKI